MTSDDTLGYGAVRAPVWFAAAGGLLLAAVLLPSPTRIGFSNNIVVASPELGYPEAAEVMSPSSLVIIAERPLFNADRKKDFQPATENALPGLDSYRLTGLIVTGTSGVAIVERSKTKTSVTLRIGDLLDGRKVSAITAAGVTFANGANSEILSIPKMSGASTSSLGKPETVGGDTTNNNNMGVRDHK